ncbi:hypothetical protein Ancab_001338 [Ancistrocladus abbreviatus]
MGYERQCHEYQFHEEGPVNVAQLSKTELAIGKGLAKLSPRQKVQSLPNGGVPPNELPSSHHIRYLK